MNAPADRTAKRISTAQLIKRQRAMAAAPADRKAQRA
jgi:hypothetical protein